MGEVLLFSLTAALNPTLVAASTMMMLLPNPKKLMLGYLLGALTISISLGIAIVLTLNNSSAVTTTKRTLSPAVDIALGAILLLLAFVLSTGRPERAAQQRRMRRESRDKAPPRWQQALSKGSPRTTFVIGAMLTLPGASYLAGLHEIHELKPSTGEAILLVVAFNIVMLALLEVPLACFFVAPDWTPGAIDRAKRWISQRAVEFAVRGFGIVGALLIVKGVIGLIAS